MIRVLLNNEAVWGYIAEANLSQNDLARTLGISSGYLSQLVTGSRSPSPKLRRRMLDVLAPLPFATLFRVVESEAGHGGE